LRTPGILIRGADLTARSQPALPASGPEADAAGESEGGRVHGRVAGGHAQVGAGGLAADGGKCRTAATVLMPLLRTRTSWVSCDSVCRLSPSEERGALPPLPLAP
jgi:hypothetical protein